MHPIIKVLLLIFPWTLQASYAQAPNIDVQHYTFRITLSDDSDTIAGQAEVTVRFDRELTGFSLDLIGKNDAASGTGMEVASVSTANGDLAFVHENDRLRISVDPPARADEARTYTIRYAGQPADGLIIAENKHGDRTFFGDNWPNRARHWLPTVDHPSDKATVEFIVTAPDRYQVIGNGLMVEETDLLDGQRRTHWRTDVPLATKVAVIGAARFAVQHAGEFKNIPIQHWIYPQDREAGFYDFGVTNQIMTFFDANIGPFTYEKLANVQSKTRYGGMENASNIFYSENAIGGTRGNEGLVAHEIAHQWFGNSATEADWQHIWLSEGFATYFTQLYFEATYGRERLVSGMQAARESVLRFYERRPNAPIVNPEITDPNEHLNANSYQKGAWVLHMLRHHIGDEAFWQGIQSYYATYRDKNATSEQLQKEMEAASGKNLQSFFSQWLYQPGQPMFKGTWRYSNNQVHLSLEQTQRTPQFNIPLELAITLSDGSRQTETVMIEERKKSFSFDVSAAPTSIELDPDTWLLARFDLKKR